MFFPGAVGHTLTSASDTELASKCDSLFEQLSYLDKYETCLIVDQINLFKIIYKKKFYTCILNLSQLEEDVIKFIKIFEEKNKHKNIILYQDNNTEKSIENENNIMLLTKPFKLKKLFNYIKNIQNEEETCVGI